MDTMAVKPTESGLKHVQVREYVRSLVAEAAPGSAAPSERELVARFGVARMTVRQALDVLVTEGLLLFVSYAVQQRFVFTRRASGSAPRPTADAVTTADAASPASAASPAPRRASDD